MVHSTFDTVPLTLNVFEPSYSVVNEWCAKAGRDPREIERTANVGGLTAKGVQEWLDAGLQHFVLRMAHPFGTKDVERMIKLRDS